MRKRIYKSGYSHLSGFTWIELLIVIGILGIIAATGFPNIHDYIERSRSMQPIELLSPIVVDGIEQQLSIGMVRIKNPLLMKPDETKNVDVILATGSNVDRLFTKTQSGYQSHIDEVKISNKMEAQLASQHFDVVPETPGVQAVGANGTTNWGWLITPKSNAEGGSNLTLTLSAIIPVQGQPTNLVIGTYTRTIYVDVSKPTKVWKFMQENMYWLWAPLLVALSIALKIVRFVMKLMSGKIKKSG